MFMGLNKTHIFGWILLLASPALGQDPSAVLEGQLTDRTGGAVPEARVTVTQDLTGLTRTQAATELGHFVFPLLPVGDYTLAVERAQFAPFRQSSIRLNVSETVRVKVVLEVAAAQ